MKVKKICMLSSAHSAFDDRIFYREAKTLVKVGYKVYLIISQDKYKIINSIQIVLSLAFLRIDGAKK